MHIKDDFGKGPISQVPASWFNSVAKFINGLIPGDGIVFTKSCDGTPTVVSIGDKVNTTGQTTYTDNTGVNESEGPEDPPSISFTGWDAGGTNALKLRLYALMKNDEEGNHYFYPIDITIAANGTVRSVSIPTSGTKGTYEPTRIGA